MTPLRHGGGPIAAGVLVLLGLLAACTSAAGRHPAPHAVFVPAVSAAASAHGVPAFYTPPRPLPPGAPGTLVRAQRCPGRPRSAR